MSQKKSKGFVFMTPKEWKDKGFVYIPPTQKPHFVISKTQSASKVKEPQDELRKSMAQKLSKHNRYMLSYKHKPQVSQMQQIRVPSSHVPQVQQTGEPSPQAMQHQIQQMSGPFSQVPDLPQTSGLQLQVPHISQESEPFLLPLPPIQQTQQMTTYVERHKCSICHKVFSQKDTLEAHLKVHQVERRECSICHEVFSHNAYLEAHLKVHQVEKIECCICQKVFLRKYDLEVHMLMVHGPSNKRYTCNICHKNCLTKSSFEEHLKVDHELALKVTTRPCDKRYVCNICYKEFSQGEGSLREHMSKVHQFQYPEGDSSPNGKDAKTPTTNEGSKNSTSNQAPIWVLDGPIAKVVPATYRYIHYDKSNPPTSPKDVDEVMEKEEDPLRMSHSPSRSPVRKEQEAGTQTLKIESKEQTVEEFSLDISPDISTSIKHECDEKNFIDFPSSYPNLICPSQVKQESEEEVDEDPLFIATSSYDSIKKEVKDESKELKVFDVFVDVGHHSESSLSVQVRGETGSIWQRRPLCKCERRIREYLY